MITSKWRTTYMAKRMTTEEFISKAKAIHGNKYDYSKVEYKNTKTKVCIICPEHGEFWMKPNDHLSRKFGCHKCGWAKEGENRTKTTEEFIKEAREKYGNRFDYSKVDYKKGTEKVCIICHEKDAYGVEIGEFWQTPANHLTYGYSGEIMPVTTERFIERAKKVHGDFYNYSKTVFEKSTKKVVITCPIHGDFEQTPHLHLRGESCPKCKNVSALEVKTRTILKSLNIDFYEQKRFEFLGKQSLDFYIPKLKMAIECQGRQHFIGSEIWENLDILVERDRTKNILCEKNGVNIVYVIDKKYSTMDSMYSKENTMNIKDLKTFLEKVIKKEEDK